ncbi:response regulator transcription factor [Shewanella dokdonensis]|uniref:Response regulator n=1 Tax=Shewanella dokdonensis TaxID=712036 RepID=A0ABX8DFH9_9GAMM|nr:response regulator [Shewanella dokdonensis]MCL1075069.1 response regulator [Shewanella dokdonensis]QVK23483.1 response regulator [Shewanella dokdonensis]
MQKIIVIDDDVSYLQVLQRRLQHAGAYEVSIFTSATAALQQPVQQIDAILLDMMLEQASGLDAIPALKKHFNPTQFIMLTGYASIATTVEAMRRGATDYLAKPVGLNEILQRLQGSNNANFVADGKPLTPAQVEWEHIQRTLLDHAGNISATAKALGLHRRTLQRKLQKHSPARIRD